VSALLSFTRDLIAGRARRRKADAIPAHVNTITAENPDATP
jgi:hypothetical protein